MATPAQRPWIRRIGATGLVLTSLAFPASVTTAVTAQAATAGDSRQQATLAVLRGKAEAGDSGAMLALGQYYLGGLPLDGKPLKADPAEALRWLRQAANHNNAEAACTLASIYRSRNDAITALSWTQRAAKGGAPACMFALGMRMLSGADFKNPQQAFAWIKKAADTGFLPAQFQLGQLYLAGTGTPKDSGKAVAAFQALAQRGVPAAMFYVCAMTGTTKKQEAREWCKKAAGAGNRMAMYQLGTIYLTGDGVPRNETEARRWYARAAALGEPNSMFWLGMLDERGIAGPQNSQQAARWVMKALRSHSLQIDGLLQQPANWSPAFWKALQTQLKQAGVYQESIDGRFTKATMQAIAAVIKQGA